MIRGIDPYRSYRFLVEIEGLIVAGFSDVSGLSAETTVKSFRQGGVNNFEYKLPEYTKYSNITLKRGITENNILWKWYELVTYGTVIRRSVSIILKRHEYMPGLRWNFNEAFPVKWEGPQLNASSNVVAVESFVLAHQGLSKAL